MFLLINTIDLNDIYSLAITYVPLTRHVIPEPLSALITLVITAWLVLTTGAPKKPKRKKRNELLWTPKVGQKITK